MQWRSEGRCPQGAAGIRQCTHLQRQWAGYEAQAERSGPSPGAAAAPDLKRVTCLPVLPTTVSLTERIERRSGSDKETVGSDLARIMAAASDGSPAPPDRLNGIPLTMRAAPGSGQLFRHL